RQLMDYAARLRAPSSAPRQRQRIAEVCRQLRIDQRLDQLVGTLSGGQRKRVSIALELLTEPSLLMLDEPTSGLDAGMAREVMNILKEYAEAGRTVIVITPSPTHLRMAQQVLVLASEGRPVYSGLPIGELRALRVANHADLMDQLT